MKAAIYCRVSTEEQHADKQEDICREYCKRSGHSVYKVYKDVISGTKESRPSFNKLLEDLRHFKFDAVLVTKLDRLGRSLQHLLSLIDEFKRKGVHFIAATQNIDTTTAMGEAFFQMIGVFAQLERGMVKERVKLAFDKKISDGESLSRAPLGYIYNNGKLAIDKLNSKKIKTIFEMRVAGIHYKIISEKLNIPISTLYTIIKNPTYAGKIKYKGEIYDGVHVAIIDPVLFNNLNPRQAIKSNTLVDWVS